jgi:hypothetical protein
MLAESEDVQIMTIMHAASKCSLMRLLDNVRKMLLEPVATSPKAPAPVKAAEPAAGS